MNPFPLWFNETPLTYTGIEYSLVVGADGYFNNYLGIGSLYMSVSNHDYMTFDSTEGKRPERGVTTSMFKIFLWEGSDFDDKVLQKLTTEAF